MVYLTAIDANAVLGFDQAFAFIGGAPFHSVKGELRLAVGARDTIVQADIDGNGNGTADFTISIRKVINLDATDFLL